MAVQPQRLLVEGMELAYEPHGVCGQPGSYRRLRARCPHHTECAKPRVFSEALGRKSGLGDDEPYAYLGGLAARRPGLCGRCDA